MIHREAFVLEKLYRYSDLDTLLLLYTPDSYAPSTPLTRYLTEAAAHRKATLNSLILKVPPSQGVSISDSLGAVSINSEALHGAAQGEVCGVLSRCAWVLTGRTLRRSKQVKSTLARRLSVFHPAVRQTWVTVPGAGRPTAAQYP